MQRLTLLLWIACAAALACSLALLAEPTETVLLGVEVVNESAEELAFLTSTLAQYNATATFFLPGDWAAAHPALVRELAAGHEVACRTMTLPRLPEVNGSRLRWELGACKALLENLTGEPVLGFRAPHGLLDERTAALLPELGYAYDASAVEHYAWFSPATSVAELEASSLGPLPHSLLLRLGDLGYFLVRQDNDARISLPLRPAHVRAHRGAFQYLIGSYADDGVRFSQHRDALPAEAVARYEPLTPAAYERPELLLT